MPSRDSRVSCCPSNPKFTRISGARIKKTSLWCRAARAVCIKIYQNPPGENGAARAESGAGNGREEEEGRDRDRDRERERERERKVCLPRRCSPGCPECAAIDRNHDRRPDTVYLSPIRCTSASTEIGVPSSGSTAYGKFVFSYITNTGHVLFDAPAGKMERMRAIGFPPSLPLPFTPTGVQCKHARRGTRVSRIFCFLFSSVFFFFFFFLFCLVSTIFCFSRRSTHSSHESKAVPSFSSLFFCFFLPPPPPSLPSFLPFYSVARELFNAWSSRRLAPPLILFP